MNQENPYAAPQTIDLIDRQGHAIQSHALGSPRDFLWFRFGAIVWLVGLAALVVAICLEDRGWLLALVPIFLMGTILLDCIPPPVPGRSWFGVSAMLQVVSPIFVLLAIQDVPNPDWERIAWYQRIGIWGEMIALLCVLVGMYKLSQWLHFSLLRWSVMSAIAFFSFCFLFDTWIRSTPSMGYDAILYGLIFGFFGLLPAFLSLLACFFCALLVPSYVGRPFAPPYNPHALPDVIDFPIDSSPEESP